MPARQGIGFAAFGLAAIGLNLGVFSCSAETATDDPSYGGTRGGGSSGSGGSLSAGGSSGPGGSFGSGGSFGGASGSAGSSGGTVNSGGNGGSGQGGFGGSSGASGGSTGNGGSNAGGSANTGGSTGSGGSNGSGGSGGTTCTDTPPPNGDTCAHAVEYGWCGQPWMNGTCAASCRLCNGGTGGSGGSSAGSGGRGGASGSNGAGGISGAGGVSGAGGSNGSGGSGGSGQPPPITSGGQNGWMSRYWDCCKPACGWRDNAGGTPMRSCGQQNQTLSSFDTANACPSPGGDKAFMCWSGAPWQVTDTFAYGFVAASGSNYHCGRCYQVDFTGDGHDDNSPQRIRGKTMIVQVINNGGVGTDQLDLLVPGGGVGDFAAACPSQWGQGVALGDRYGGFRRTCGDNASCVRNMCEAAFGSKSELMGGCNWFLGWFSNVNNPRIVFKQIACPAAITQRSGMPDRP